MWFSAAPAAGRSPPLLALQSLHDGLCLSGSSPPRFGVDCDPVFLSDGADDGRRVSVSGAKQAAFKGTGDDTHRKRLRLQLHLRYGRLSAHRELSPHETPMFACADRWCLRCLNRGNANRARLGLCALDGYEALRATPSPRQPVGYGVAALLGALLAPRALTLLLLLVALALSLAGMRGLKESVRRLDRSRQTALAMLRKSRVALRQARDESRAPKLLSKLRTGGRFVEIRPRSASFAAAHPLGRCVLLRLDPERLEIDVFADPTRTSPSAPSSLASSTVGSRRGSASASGRASPRSGSPRASRPDAATATAAGRSPRSMSPRNLFGPSGEPLDGSSGGGALPTFLYTIQPQAIAKMAFAKPDPPTPAVAAAGAFSHRTSPHNAQANLARVRALNPDTSGAERAAAIAKAMGEEGGEAENQHASSKELVNERAHDGDGGGEPLPVTSSAPWRCISLEVNGDDYGGYAEGALPSFGLRPAPVPILTPFAVRPTGEVTGGTGGGGMSGGPPSAAPHETVASPAPGGSRQAATPSPDNFAGGGSPDGIFDDATRLIFAAESDDGALQWFLGMQEWLRTMGHLDTPARPAKLLWARVRLKLAKRASRMGVPPGAVLAKALRVAASERRILPGA